MTRATLIDGKAMAAELTESIRREAEELTAAGVQPGLAVVIVGEDPASQVYVRNKQRTAESCGFLSVKHTLEATVDQQSLLQLIDTLNEDDAIHGILVQLPLPDHLDEEAVTQAIRPEKDVDGFHLVNVGKLTALAETSISVDAFGQRLEFGSVWTGTNEEGTPDFSGQCLNWFGDLPMDGSSVGSLYVCMYVCLYRELFFGPAVQHPARD